ncbi:hypothetical protein PO909_002887 [Leuciscus waleckii]
MKVSISNQFEPDSDPDNVNEQEDRTERISCTYFASTDFTGRFRVNKKMLRLLILFLILQGSGDDEDGDGDIKEINGRALEAGPGLDKSTGDEDAGGTLVIIIAAVSITVLAIGAIVAIVLFRRYLQNREQGVYSVPVEQGQKAAV